MFTVHEYPLKLPVKFLLANFKYIFRTMYTYCRSVDRQAHLEQTDAPFLERRLVQPQRSVELKLMKRSSSRCNLKAGAERPLSFFAFAFAFAFAFFGTSCSIHKTFPG